jgi:glyoxylase I family protein
MMRTVRHADHASQAAGRQTVARGQGVGRIVGSPERSKLMNPSERHTASAVDPKPSAAGKDAVARGLWGVRYQVKDVARSIEFYTRRLGFHLDQQHLPAFGQVSIEGLKLILSGPGASGSRPMPDGRSQEPGGWNRVVLHVTDLPARIEALTRAGLSFRNRMEAGPGGRQIQLEDPDGNAIELFEPAG